MHFYGNSFKSCILNTVDAKVIIFTWYVQSSVYKQDWPLTFQKLSETIRPVEIKFHMTTPYDWLAKRGGLTL